MSYGSRLANGAKSATFSQGSVSQEKWDSIFSDYEPEVEYEISKVVLRNENIRRLKLSLPKLRKG